MSSDIENKCIKKGLRLTDQRKLVAKVMSEADNHPDVDELHKRVSKLDSKISIATVYRTVKLFEDANVIIKHDFKYGEEKARYEPITNWEHNHLIDIVSGKVIEFHNPGFEKLSNNIAEKLGYKIVGYKLELFALKEACKKIK